MDANDSWDFVDKIIYINLEEAIERRKNMEKLLNIIPQDKIIRFDAIKNEKGAIGCSQSHIECVKLAIKNNWNNVLIIEDDVMWNNYEKSLEILNNLAKKEYDVILLGGTFVNFDKSTLKLYSGQTTTAYLVSQHYYKKLLSNFIEGLLCFIKTDDYLQYAIDKHWKKLQGQDNWYIIHPALLIQKPSYSYIEKTNVNYVHWFNV